MPKSTNTFKLGLATLLFVALFVAVLLFIGGRTGGGGLKFVVRFAASDLGARLKAGGEIECGGQVVGTIRSITMREVSEGGAAPTLYVYVSADVDPVIGLRQDAVIVPGEPLLGDVGTLIITDRGVGKPIDPARPLDGQKAYSLDTALALLGRELDPNEKGSLITLIKGQLDPDQAASLIAKIHASLDDLNSITRSISVQLSPGQRDSIIVKLHAMLDNLNAATGSLREQLDPQRRDVALARINDALDTLNDAAKTVAAMLHENRPAIASAVGHVQHTTVILDEQIAARIAEQLDVRNAASLLAKVHVGLDGLNRSLEDLNAITGEGRTLIVSNREMINAMVVNLKSTSDNLDAASREIYRNPWRLLYKPSERESKQLNVFDAARSFAQAAADLDNAAIRLQGVVDAGGTVGADDKELIQIRDSLKQTFETFKKAEQGLWQQLGVK